MLVNEEKGYEEDERTIKRTTCLMEYYKEMGYLVRRYGYNSSEKS